MNRVLSKYGKKPFKQTKYYVARRRKQAVKHCMMAAQIAIGLGQVRAIKSSSGNPATKAMMIAKTLMSTQEAIANVQSAKI